MAGGGHPDQHRQCGRLRARDLRQRAARGGREFRVEWEAAVEARKRRPREPDGSPARFILPVAVDGTDMQANEVRPYFGGTQALQLPGGTDEGSLVTALRELVRAARLAAEGRDERPRDQLPAVLGPTLDADILAGLASFREQDGAFFKGRDQEIAELRRMVQSQRLTCCSAPRALARPRCRGRVFFRR